MVIPAPTPKTFKVKDAWRTLPEAVWNEETASHLLRRLTFAATPDAVRSALKSTPKAVVIRAFRQAEPLDPSTKLVEYRDTIQEKQRFINREIDDPEEQRAERSKLRHEEARIFRDFGMSWFYHARKPENSATEKFVLFLQDVFVVDRRSVRDVPKLFSLQKTIREGTQMKYPDLCKRVSREPAMIRYLDLDKNTSRKPNENFARELFELFTLGEGQYTEEDIKEAARAFTGYRVRNRYEYVFQKKMHDDGKKTVFRQTGRWDGDNVIDITFQQPAARTFLIKELIKFYLTDEVVPEPYIEELGGLWAAHQFDMTYLIETFFSSRIFYHPAYRGNFIKSPVHFYLGLCHDLRIDVIPFKSKLLRSMDVMGQSFFNPPNVRGWLYGENWINSTSVSARRQVVDYLFTKLEERRLNGNDKLALETAQKEGRGDFLVTKERLSPLLQMEASAIAKHLTTYFITEPPRPAYLPVIEKIIKSSDSLEDGIRNAIIALLQSPAYNLS